MTIKTAFAQAFKAIETHRRNSEEAKAQDRPTQEKQKEAKAITERKIEAKKRVDEIQKLRSETREALKKSKQAGKTEAYEEMAKQKK
jgi:hypothetical protein